MLIKMETGFNVENPPRKRKKIMGKIFTLYKNKVQELITNNELSERENLSELKSEIDLSTSHLSLFQARNVDYLCANGENNPPNDR